jgi:hypothetical protein
LSLIRTELAEQLESPTAYHLSLYLQCFARRVGARTGRSADFKQAQDKLELAELRGFDPD